MPKSIAAVLLVIVASLASGCTTGGPRYFNGNDYGDGVYNGGARDRPAYARLLHKHRHHHRH
jgi:hypothetical protein